MRFRLIFRLLQQLSCGDARAGHGVGVEDLIDVLLGEDALLEDEVLHGGAGADRFLRDVGGVLVADVRGQSGDDADGVVDVALAALAVCGDADDAVVGQCVDRVNSTS